MELIDYNVEPPRSGIRQYATNRGFRDLPPGVLEQFVIYTLSSIGVRDERGRGWAVVYSVMGPIADMIVLRVC